MLYANLSDFGKYPPVKLENIARLGVAVDELIEEYNLQAVAIRCWDELEKTWGIAPCLILGELNERGIAAACELDVNNAVMMRALYLGSRLPGYAAGCQQQLRRFVRPLHPVPLWSGTAGIDAGGEAISKSI